MTKTTYILQRTWHLDYFNTDYSTKSCLPAPIKTPHILGLLWECRTREFWWFSWLLLFLCWKQRRQFQLLESNGSHPTGRMFNAHECRSLPLLYEENTCNILVHILCQVCGKIWKTKDILKCLCWLCGWLSRRRVLENRWCPSVVPASGSM